MAVATVHGTDELAKRLLGIGAKAPIAQMRAINHTLAKAKTRAVKAIVADLSGGIAEKAISRSIFFKKATPGDVVGELSIGPYLREDEQQPHKLGRIPMFLFRPVRQLPRGVQAGRMFAPRAFIPRLRSGHEGIFGRRSGDGPSGLVRRLPIDERFGPSPRRVFKSKLLDQHVAAARKDFHARTLHEIDVILRGIVPTGEGA